MTTDKLVIFAFGGTGGTGQTSVPFIGNQVIFYTAGPGGALTGIQITTPNGLSTTYGTVQDQTPAYTINSWAACTYRLNQIWVTAAGSQNIITGFVMTDADSKVPVGSNAGVEAIINSGGFLFDFVGLSAGSAIDLVVIQAYPG